MVQVVWNQLEDLSFLTVNSFIQVSIPGVPSMIHNLVIRLIFIDILYTENWMPKFMESIGLYVDNIDNDEAVNIFFEENGFQSKQFLKNAGSTFFFLVFYVFGWLILFIIQWIAQFWQVFIPLKNKF